MKKLSILIVLMVIAVGVKAQGHYIIPTIGTSFGLSFSMNENTSSNANIVTRFNTGFNAGVDYRYEFKKPFLIEVGLLYNQSQYRYGMKVEYDQHIHSWKELIKYNQLTVPVYFGYKFAIGSKKTFSITPKIGLLYCYYLNGKFVYSDLYDTQEEYKFEVKDKSNLGIILGVDFGWKLNERLSILLSIMESTAIDYVYGYGKGLFSCTATVSGNVGLKIQLGKL